MKLGVREELWEDKQYDSYFRVESFYHPIGVGRKYSYTIFRDICANVLGTRLKKIKAEEFTRDISSPTTQGKQILKFKIQ